MDRRSGVFSREAVVVGEGAMRTRFWKLQAGILSAAMVAGLALVVNLTSHSWGQNAPALSAPHPSTQEPAHRMTFEQVVAMQTSLSNWGRWGRDDERGTLNLITPEKTKQALSLVKDGVVVPLARFASLEKAIDNFNFGETQHEMWYGAAGPPKPGQTRGALDTIRYGLHDGTNSHMDALCHYTLLHGGKVVVYNGHPSATEKGCSHNGVDHMGPGFATRAVLVDMPLLKNVPWLEPHTPIYPEDLEAWEKFASVKIGSGDAVLIRTGRWALRAAKGPWQPSHIAGLHVSCVRWLKARDVAIAGSDACLDVLPSGVPTVAQPVHQLLLIAVGMPIFDNLDLEALAAEAGKRNRWTFLIT